MANSTTSVSEFKAHLSERLGSRAPLQKGFRDIRPDVKVDIDFSQYVIEDREDRLP